jgi:hypothetical protein
VSEQPVPIRCPDPDQQDAAIQSVAAEVARIMTSHEEIVYIARQNLMALSTSPDSVVATTNRVIFYRPSILGQASFQDFLWQDVERVEVIQGMLSSRFLVETVEGEQIELGELDKEQAKRLYGYCQQMEQEWREKRRIREIEEARARSGGIVIGGMAGVGGAPGEREDAVQKLARAKAMLDQSLISEAEYDSLKAKILSEM